MKIELNTNEDITINLNSNNCLRILTKSGKQYTLWFWEKTVAIQINNGKINNINSDEDFVDTFIENLDKNQISSRGCEINNDIKFSPEIPKELTVESINNLRDIKKIMDSEGIIVEPHIVNGEIISYDLVDKKYEIHSPTKKDDKKCEKKVKKPYKIKINKCNDFDDWYRTYTGQIFVVDTYIETDGYWVKRKNLSNTYFVNKNDAEVIVWK